MEAKNIVNFTENDIANLTINNNEKEDKRKEYISFQLNDSVSSFTGRKIELLKIHNILEDHKKLVICGLGGVGKSELIRAYCKEYQTSYGNNFIWINAETENDIKKSFYELASELNIKTSNKLRKRNLKEIVKEEYLYFKNEKCLVIFDNALCLKDLLPYIPSNSSNISVLISSQNKEWGNVNKFELDVLTEEESIELMNSLSLSQDHEDVNTLVNMLQFLPLAIQQAAAYIIDQKYISDTYKIRDYINIFDNEEAILAVTYDDAPFPDYSEQLYDKTIYKTLQITLAKIKNELALELLYVCAYLSPDNIEKSLFLSLISNEDITELNKLIRELEKYFLITVKRDYKYTCIPSYFSSYFNSESTYIVKEIQRIRQGDIIFIHRVVQKNIRYILKSRQLANSVIEEALALATNDFDLNGLHLPSILKYADQTACLHFYKNYCRNKESFLCLLSCDKYFDTFKLLFNSGIDFDIKSSLLPIHVALGGSVDMMKYIIERGANIYIKTMNGTSAIQAASQNNRLDLLSYLIQQGSSVNVVDKKGCTPLHLAVFNNHLNAAQYLINKGASINAVCNDGCTLLIIAAQYRYLEMTKYLLAIGCGIDTPDNKGLIPLHYAAQNGHMEIVQCLVENGAVIDKNAPFGCTALLIAVQNNDFDMAKFLIEKGCDVNYSPYSGRTSLHRATFNGNIKIVQFLVNNGSNINSVDFDGNTSLFYALEKKHFAVVDYLLENGALINISNLAGNTCLHIAARKGHLNLVKCLIAKNVPVNISNFEDITPLHGASENGHLDIVKYLLDNGALDKSTQLGYTCLLLAAKNGFLHIVEYLVVNKGFDINSAAGNGFKAIHFACLNGHLEIVKFLIEKGISVDTIVENGGYTPLLIAAFNGHLQIVQYLINHGASIILTTNHGENLIHLSAENGHLEMIKFLKSIGFNLNAVANNGIIPLHVACRHGHLDVVQYLIDSGSPLNHVCNDGNTPLHIASLGGHQHIVEYLINSGADADRNQICDRGFTAADLGIEIVNNEEIIRLLLTQAYESLIYFLKNEN